MPADSHPHANQPDFSLHGSGTVFLFEPLTERASQWLETHCPPTGDHQYFGDALAIEHRYVSNIILLATLAGLQPLDFSSRNNDQNPASETLAERSVS